MRISLIMQKLGNPQTILLCWAAGGIFALCGALCYGESGAMFSKAGGEYVFLRESYGKGMAFLSGWISLIVGFSAPIAAAAIAFASYLFRTLPDLSGRQITLFVVDMVAVSPVTIMAAIVIMIFSLIHFHSLRLGAGV